MISVLMCTYNREHCLKKAIDSVLGQSYKDFEFIIVDDGSTDGTETLIKAYEDERIRYYKMERNSYYCYAANEGLKLCKGKYVAFMNSDDIWLPEKLEKQVAFMEENREYGACFTSVSLIDAHENDITDACSAMRDTFARKYKNQKECIQYLIGHGNTLCHPSAMVRKEVMDQVGGFHLLFCQTADYELWIRIASQYPIHILEEKLVQFRWDTTKNDQVSVVTKESAIRTFNELVMIKKQAINRLSDEKFKEYFGEIFREKTSSTHLELEFERAFFLMGCMIGAPELRVLGMEKLEQVMQEDGAMDTLRQHFNLDIFDIYKWNAEHMYKNPVLTKELQDLEQKCQEWEQKHQEQENTIQELHHRIGQLTAEAEQREALIHEYASSTSWKITEPLRKIMRWIKK